MEEFYRVCDRTQTPLITGEDGLKVLQIIEAANSSATSGGQMCEVGKLEVERFGL